MSGAGRKSGYRKGATKYFEEDEIELGEHDRIGRIVLNRGANVFDCQISESEEDKIMVKLPNKFLKVVWVKVKDYVVIEDCTSKDEIPQIKYVLNRDHIKYLKKQNRWPAWLLSEEGDSSISTSNIVSKNSYMDDLLPDGVEDNEEEEYEEETEN